MTPPERRAVLVHARMSAAEMVAACGFKMSRASTWTYHVRSAAGETLYTGTLRGVKAWLRKEGYVA